MIETMDDRISLGILALVLGLIVGTVLFVPFVAISYRRRGGLSFGRFVLWTAALVYFLAIWTYTLLPLPDPDAIRCVGVNLNVLEFIADIDGAIARPGSTITDPAVLQLLFNVLLFVPLGFFIRVLGGRGFLVAVAVGFGVSLFIETTQVTGVWGIYSCAYRVFDVDDLLTNTLGAALGSLASLIVPRRHRGSPRRADADVPRPVTRARRALAVLCDLLAFALVAVATSVTAQVVLEVTGRHDLVVAGTVADWLGPSVAAGVWLVVVLSTGRSVGDLAVQLRYRGGIVPTPVARLLRWLGGISGFALLDLLPDPWSLAAVIFALASLIAFFTTAAGRGIPGLVSGMRLADAREAAAVSSTG